MAAIIQKLNPNTHALRNAPITFVGCTLFIAFNPGRPPKPDEKLIDPDDPTIGATDSIILKIYL